MDTPNQPLTTKAFQKIIYTYYRKEKRPLPWRQTRDPYKILVSEVMLQQTQAHRVVPKYREFIKRFPTAQSLAQSSTREVLSLWSGLGYNRRALYLRQTALAVLEKHTGTFPKTEDALRELPGIGPYTARALLAFAYNKPVVMIETNIRAVFIHFFFPKKKKVSDAILIPYIEKYADIQNPREWNNALMDYGAMLKKTIQNPSRNSAHHTKQTAFKGSLRQVRGAIIKAYTNNGTVTKRTLIRILPYTKEVIENQYKKLVQEGFFE